MATSLPADPTIHRRPHRAIWGLLPIAAGLAILSFAQAAAATGLSLSLFASLGPSFFAWQPGYRPLARQVTEAQTPASLAGPIHAAEQRVLAHAPLSSEPLLVTALYETARGNASSAHARMIVADRLTRRDAMVQMALIDYAAQDGDLAGLLRHYDAVLRTREDIRPLLLPKLVAALALDDVRSGLVAYATPENPWFAQFVTLASREGGAARIATIVLRLNALPATPDYRAAYQAMVAELADEGRYDLLRALYPRLPDAGGTKGMSDPGANATPGISNYPPLQWMPVNNTDRIATVSGSGHDGTVIQVEAEPLTDGKAVSRLFLLPSTPEAFEWTVERADQEKDVEAHWSIQCQDSGLGGLSANILAGGRTRGAMKMPRPCQVPELTLTVNGGTSSQGPAFSLSRLHWLSSGDASPGRKR